MSGQHTSLNGLLIKEPLKLKGVLNEYKSIKTTPIIGTEFPDAKLAEWMKAPNSDELLLDLAITSEHLKSYRQLHLTQHILTTPSLSTRRSFLPVANRSNH
jgi:hypothetical protein